eukprot:scaffold771_cov387-Prasinococcus_capsulatus_cf.AAC.19
MAAVSPRATRRICFECPGPCPSFSRQIRTKNAVAAALGRVCPHAPDVRLSDCHISAALPGGVALPECARPNPSKQSRRPRGGSQTSAGPRPSKWGTEGPESGPHDRNSAGRKLGPRPSLGSRIHRADAFTGTTIRYPCKIYRIRYGAQPVVRRIRKGYSGSAPSDSPPGPLEARHHGWHPSAALPDLHAQRPYGGSRGPRLPRGPGSRPRAQGVDTLRAFHDASSARTEPALSSCFTFQAAWPSLSLGSAHSTAAGASARADAPAPPRQPWQHASPCYAPPPLSAGTAGGAGQRPACDEPRFLTMDHQFMRPRRWPRLCQRPLRSPLVRPRRTAAKNVISDTFHAVREANLQKDGGTDLSRSMIRIVLILLPCIDFTSW